MWSPLIECLEPNKRFTLEEDINIATSTYGSSLFQLVAQEQQSFKMFTPVYSTSGSRCYLWLFNMQTGLEEICQTDTWTSGIFSLYYKQEALNTSECDLWSCIEFGDFNSGSKRVRNPDCWITNNFLPPAPKSNWPRGEQIYYMTR